MKKVIILLWLMVFSHSLFAGQQCSFKGNDYFTIQFDVIGSDTYQEVYITNNGGKRTETIWYTGDKKTGNDYIFNEQGLIDTVEYQVKIINDGNNSLVKYYLRRKLNNDAGWVLIEQQNKDIHQGNVKVLSNNSDIDLMCEESNIEPEEPLPFDQCEYFPQPVQSWVTKGTEHYADFPDSILDVKNGNTQIKGWSENYVNYPGNLYQYKQDWQGGASWNTLRVGFDEVSDKYIAYENPNSTLCNGEMGCYPGNSDGMINLRKAPAPEPLDIEFSSTDELSITPYDYDKTCDGVLCSAIQTNGVFYINIYKDLKSLTLGFYDKEAHVEFKGDRKIEELKTGSGVRVKLRKFENITLGKVVFDGGAGYIDFESSVRINIINEFNIGNSVLYFTYDNSESFTFPMIYGPNASMTFNSPYGGGAIKAFLLAKHMKFPNQTTVEGSITANQLTVDSGLTLIPLDGTPDCWSESEDEDKDYFLSITPLDSYALICETQTVKFQVLNDKAQPTGEFTGSINVSPFANLTLVSGKGTGSNGNYTSNGNGELWFDLSSSVSQSFTITGTLNPKGGSSSAIGTYHFVPYKFAAEDQYVIANKPQDVSVKVLACNEGDVVDIGYNGQPTVTSEWQAPLNGVGNVTFSPNFNAGNVTADSQKLVMEESGIRTVTMTDANFDCSDPKYNCPIEGGGPLQGSFTVYSRPWTFAICSSDGKSMDGNIEDRNSVGFASAGSPFDLHIRPLRWVSSSGDNSDPQVGDREIETSAYCSSPVTQNFFATDDFLKAKVLLTHNVAEPEDGNNGELSGSLLLTNRDGIDSSYLPFHNLAWDEVGVLRVNADLEGKYLGMTVNQGYRNIGRFYPAYFKITQSQWSLADQNNIAYLSQPYDSAELAVTPYALGGNGNTVQNYHRFNPLLQATISLLEDDDRKGRLVLDTELGSWGSKEETSQWYLDDSNAVFQRAYQASLESGHQVSIVDGPYNTSDSQSSSTAFGFTVIAAVDPVDSRSESQCSEGCNSLDLTFPDQPPARYGRMRLMDVGGTSVEPIAVPLRVEFWQGSRFVTNTQDNGSTFSTDENLICKQIIWSYSGNASTSTLSGEAGKVSQGESSAISATPSSTTENIREQVRFWLRLDDDDTNDDSQQQSAQVGETSIECPSGYLKQPWLRYNWRAKGDEDPSAVVTFGIFRGNDRVIFRGEPGLTGH